LKNLEEEIMPRKKKLDMSQRPVENTLRRIAIYRNWRILDRICNEQKEEDGVCQEMNQDRGGVGDAYGTDLQGVAVFLTGVKTSP
jgi:hypothetical protein